MGGRRDLDRNFNTLLWASVSAALVTEVYLFVARAGLLVRSPLALLVPGLMAGVLCAIIFAAALSFDHRQRANWIIVGLVVTYVAALVVLAFVPPVARDELTYHLAMPKLFLRQGRFWESPTYAYSYFPMLLELQFLPLLAHCGEWAPKLLHLTYGVAAAAVVFHLVATIRGPRSGALAATLLFTTPATAILASRAYVDLAVLFYGAVAFFALIRWHETDGWKWLILSGLAAGCVAGVKYNGLVLIVFLALAVALLASPKGSLAALRLASLFAVAAAIPALPWLMKNWAQTGNPVFPFFGEVFGGTSFQEMARVDPLTRRRWLYGESWLDIALLPIRIFVTGREGDISRFDGVFNPIFLLGFAMALRRRASRRDRVLVLVPASFLPIVFFSHDFVSRYLVVILIPLVILTVEALACLRRRMGTPATATLIVAGLLFNVGHFAVFWQKIDPLSVLSGTRSREAFITRFVPEYPVVQYANANVRSTSRVYLVFLGDRSYYWEAAVVYDQIYYASGLRLRKALSDARDGCDVAAILRADGITHIAASKPLLARSLDENLDEDQKRHWTEFSPLYMRQLFQHGGYGLYEVAPVRDRRDCD